MARNFIFNLLLLPLLLTAIVSTSTSATEVSSDPSATWDLTSLYKTEADWSAELKAVDKKIPDLKHCQGKLSTSVKSLKKCLDDYFGLQLRLAQVSVWAELQKSADQRQAINSERTQLTGDLGSRFSEGTAFFSPELSKIKPAYVKSFLKQPGTQIYKHYLEMILNQAKHTLDPAREEQLAALSPVLYNGENLQGLLLSADIEWKTITLANGDKQKINSAGYTKLRESPNRADRKKVFEAYYATLSQFQRTLGANLALNIKTNVVMARLRKYKTALEASLSRDNVPDQVYRTLVAQVNAGLPVFHEFLKHEAATLGIKDFSYEDSYISSADLDLKFPMDKTKLVVLEALAPLGESYTSKLNESISQRWMEVYPHDGKVGGAFMNGSAYKVHPFVLLNHQDNFSSVSTFAHEWGHAMHTLYSNGAQDFISADAPIFTAEIASTLNEVLLHEKLIQTTQNLKEKAYYLESLLKLIRATFFRQTQFAEFELALHEEVEKDQALSGEKISEIYGRIARKYYGHDQKVMTIDDKFFSEWAFVPHFYNSFYVYQYATCLSAAFYFAEQILAKKPGAVENYLKVLKAGSSKYPYEILKDAGVDMAKPDVYQAVVRRMEKALKEIDELKSTKK